MPYKMNKRASVVRDRCPVGSERLLLCPECDGAMVPGVRKIYSDAVQRAFRDWNEKRAYVDNGGNYRVRPEPATPTHRPRGKIAPWNKEVKRLFSSCAEFHAAAQASIGTLTPQSEPDAGEEWRVGSESIIDRRRVYDPESRVVATAANEWQAAQIVSDHTAAALAPKLVAALKAARKYIDAGYQPPELIDQIDAALALVKGRE